MRVYAKMMCLSLNAIRYDSPLTLLFYSELSTDSTGSIMLVPGLINDLPLLVLHLDRNVDTAAHALGDDAVIFEQIKAAAKAVTALGVKTKRDGDMTGADTKELFLVSHHLCLHRRLQHRRFDTDFMQAEQQTGAEAVSDGCREDF